MNIEHPSWPQVLVSALPQLLATLISPPNCQSLERLQLVGFDVEIMHLPKGGPRFFNRKLKKIDGQRLLLSGDLMAEGQLMAQVLINYFMRGQRKFFCASIDQGALSKEEMLSPISFKEIAAFFLEMGQPQVFWSDENLSRLCGIPPAVPSHMIIAMMLKRAIKIFPKAVRFSMEFIRAVGVLKALSIALEGDAQSQCLLLLVDGEQAVRLTAH